MQILRLLGGILFPCLVSAQCLQGVDLSYVNAVQDNGGQYRDGAGELVDPYAYFAERGAEMVRLRLWHTPENIESACGEPITSGGLTDVLRAARRADSAGMRINLALHYADYFVDPGKQRRPAAWDGLEGEVLLDSIYRYTYRVLEGMEAQGTRPAILAVGNETDNGFVDATTPTDGFEWAIDGPKFQAGIRAVADFNRTYAAEVKSALHLTERYARYGARELEDAGVTDYDVLGVSYYPHFNPETTIGDIGELVAHLTQTYGKEVMIFETGFSYDNAGGGDAYNNFLGDNGTTVDYPATPDGQRDFLLDLTKTVCESGGTAVFYWEPAWIPSAMCDAWGQGSSYENASFFDYRRDNRALPAFEFLDYGTVATHTPAPEDAVRVLGNPAAGDHLRMAITLPATSWMLVTAAGQAVGRGRLAEEERTVRVSTDSLSSGVYFFRLLLRDGRTVSRRIRIK